MQTDQEKNLFHLIRFWNFQGFLSIYRISYVLFFNLEANLSFFNGRFFEHSGTYFANELPQHLEYSFSRNTTFLDLIESWRFFKVKTATWILEFQEQLYTFQTLFESSPERFEKVEKYFSSPFFTSEEDLMIEQTSLLRFDGQRKFAQCE